MEKILVVDDEENSDRLFGNTESLKGMKCLKQKMEWKPSRYADRTIMM